MRIAHRIALSSGGSITCNVGYESTQRPKIFMHTVEALVVGSSPINVLYPQDPHTPYWLILSWQYHTGLWLSSRGRIPIPPPYI